MNALRLISTAIMDALKKVSVRGVAAAALICGTSLIVNGQNIDNSGDITGRGRPSSQAVDAQPGWTGRGCTTPQPVDTASVEVYFPVASAVVDTAYDGNGARLSGLIETLDGARVNHIEVTGNTSPDGRFNFNKQLAVDRATNLADWLQRALSVDPDVISIVPKGIDWDGLIAAVEASDMRWRDEVLNILRNTPELVFDRQGRLVDSRKNQLMALRRGEPYRYMMEHIFPQLRRSAATARFYYEPVEVVEEIQEIVEPVVVVEEDTISTERIPVVDDGDGGYTGLKPVLLGSLQKYPMLALRSNLLLPLLNVGAELPIGNRWSVGADYYYPWVWPKKANKDCFELIFVSAEARYWLGNKHTADRANLGNRLLGHSVGVYGAWGYYDFEHNYRGRQGNGWSAGIDYLYAMPIVKGRLHLEFEVAIGGIWSDGQPYTVYEEGGVLIRDKERRKRFSYIGPTKVGVSLVLPINRVIKTIAPELP